MKLNVLIIYLCVLYQKVYLTFEFVNIIQMHYYISYRESHPCLYIIQRITPLFCKRLHLQNQSLVLSKKYTEKSRPAFQTCHIYSRPSSFKWGFKRTRVGIYYSTGCIGAMGKLQRVPPLMPLL